MLEPAASPSSREPSRGKLGFFESHASTTDELVSRPTPWSPKDPAMEFTELDPNLLLAPLMLCGVVMGALAWFTMLGGSLRFSLWLLLDDPPGYLASMAMAILILVINVSVAFGLYLLCGPQPWYVIASYQVMLQIFLVMALARCNPVSACRVRPRIFQRNRNGRDYRHSIPGFRISHGRCAGTTTRADHADQRYVLGVESIRAGLTVAK